MATYERVLTAALAMAVTGLGGVFLFIGPARAQAVCNQGAGQLAVWVQNNLGALVPVLFFILVVGGAVVRGFSKRVGNTMVGGGIGMIVIIMVAMSFAQGAEGATSQQISFTGGCGGGGGGGGGSALFLFTAAGGRAIAERLTAPLRDSDSGSHADGE